jgi:hypothetical protein
MITIDEMYKGVVSLSARVKNSNERDDIIYMAQQAYAQEDMKTLQQFYGRLKALPMAMGYTKAKVQMPRKVELGSNFESSGMFNPRVYNYFSNYNSPLNTAPAQISQPYPLYANFGAYDKKSLYS